MGRYRTIYTENQNGDGYEAEKNKTEKIRLRRKLIAVVSCMLIIGIAVQGRFAVKAVKRMVCEQAETALVVRYMQFPRMAAYSTMQTTGWTVILKAPELELTAAERKFTMMIIIIGLLLVAVILTVFRAVIRKIV